MKHWLILWLITGCSVFAAAQDLDSYASIDAEAEHLPGTVTTSASALANYIALNFKTDKEKLRAIYAWVITYITYDKDSMYHLNWAKDNESIVAATLRRRRGVCENFASLFTTVAQRAGIESFVVHGYSKKYGIVDWAGHSWSAVHINDEWLLCDPTWDAGAVKNTNYFLIRPEEFIKTHMPFDPLWQLLPYPLTNEEFYRGILHNERNKALFRFADSAKTFLQSDSLQQFEGTARRMKSIGLDNETLRTWYTYYKMKISIIYEEQDMNLYNSAVEDFNTASVLFNDFVQYRNNRFIPAKPDDEIKTLLDPVDSILASVYIKTDILENAPNNFQYNPGMLKERLNSLRSRIQEQKDFIQLYIEKTGTERKKLFYE